MTQNRWRIGFVSVSVSILILAAGCTGTDFIDSGNSNVSFEIVATGATIEPYDCIQWLFFELWVRPLDGTCAEDSEDAGDLCLSNADCDPLPQETGTCVGSEAIELVGGFGIEVDANLGAGNILGGDCTPTLDAGGKCDGVSEVTANGIEQTLCFDSIECGHCDMPVNGILKLSCDVDADCGVRRLRS